MPLEEEVEVGLVADVRLVEDTAMISRMSLTTPIRNLFIGNSRSYRNSFAVLTLQRPN
jgi:hypothetical protein